MTTSDFTTAFWADQSPEEVFKAVTDPRKWWSEEIEGDTDRLDAEFHYHYQDVHRCKMKITELIPSKRVVWLVLDNYFDFIEDKTEWTGTKIIFEIAEKNGKTQLVFTHEGLSPEDECYEVCSDAWTGYIQGSLKNLVTTEKGRPNKKEEGLNSELIEKWNLPEK